MAKKDPEQRIKYYETVREHSLALINKAEEAIQHMEAFGDDFAGVFEKTRKRHNSLLNKIVKLTERERKKDGVTAKVDVKTGKKAKPLTSKSKPSTSKPKPLTSKPKPSVSEPGSASQPEAIG